MSSLTSAIETAVETLKNESPKEETKVEETKVEETTVEDTTKVEDPEKKEEPAKEDEDTIRGRQLVQALKDPAQAAILIDFLAKQAGYSKADVKKVETVEEKKELKQDLTKILEDELGDDLKFLAPKLGKALDKYYANREVDNTDLRDTRERLNQLEMDKIQAEAMVVNKEIAKDWFDADDLPDNVQKEMSLIMERYQPNKNDSVRQYYTDIFNLVAGKLSLTKKTASTQARADRNKKDEPARTLSSQNRGTVPTREEGGGAKSLKIGDAVKLAVQQVDQEYSKKR